MRRPLTERSVYRVPKGSVDVLAFDPGGTTGWVRGTFPTANLATLRTDLWAGVEVEYGQIPGDLNLQMEEVNELLSSHRGPVVVENFTLRQFRQDVVLLYPVMVESKIDYLIYGINTARGSGGYYDLFPEAKGKGKGALPKNTGNALVKISQTPAMAKQTGTNERLKEAGLWFPGSPHALDAMRHLFTYVRRIKGKPQMLREAWPTLDWV